MPSPAEYFPYIYTLRTFPQSDGSTIYMIQSEYTSGTVDDVSNAQGDNLAVLGDIRPDTFEVVNGGASTAYSFVGANTNGDGFIGSMGGANYLFSNRANQAGFYAFTAAQPSTFDIVCFAEGTRVKTPEGKTAVELLAIGDLVATATGDVRTVRWVGHRTVDCSNHSRRRDVYPVRVSSGAFGVGPDGIERPERELRLSPGHPVLVGAGEYGEGGVLVPIMYLINGTSIDRVSVETVTYWHVELDAHDILLAENLPAESYLDGGDRPFFDEASDHAIHNPDHVAPGFGGRCRPVVLDGPLVEAERRRLEALFATSLTKQCVWPDAESATAW